MEDIKSEFTQEQYEMAYSDGAENIYWSLRRIRKLDSELQKQALQSKKILEIGCGRGGVVQALRKLNYDCWGVELAATESLPSVRPFVMKGTDAVTLDLAFRNSIEVLMLLDVLEHIPNPDTFLRSIQSAFPNATHLILTVPARKELWSNYDTYYGHFRRYDTKSLQKQLEDIHSPALSIDYFFKLLYFPGRLISLLSLDRKLKVPAVNTPAMKFLHKFIANLLVLTDNILPSSIYGTSLISVSRLKR
jgi:SAM-dependent methyltransferase